MLLECLISIKESVTQWQLFQQYVKCCDPYENISQG